MIDIFVPGVDRSGFLNHALIHSYGMQEGLVNPQVCAQVSIELGSNGYLKDLVELEPVSAFHDNFMHTSKLLHTELNETICRVTGLNNLHLSRFSVRVFNPGEFATTIHRNHPSVGPWVVGITLRGNAPFNVYDQDQLPEDAVIPLLGRDSDPDPLDTMEANVGAVWTLYTRREQLPHSGGRVMSEQRRELLIFYDLM